MVDLRSLLNDFSKGKLTVDEIQRHISLLYIGHVENEIAKLDTYREFRKCIPEVIYGESKFLSDIIKIIETLIDKKSSIVVTRLRKDDLKELKIYLKSKKYFFEQGLNSSTILIHKKRNLVKKYGQIGILCAGTSDIPIAEEARLVSKAMGCESILSYDVGIAGIHRLFPILSKMLKSNVTSIVVAAGMEGALPSFVSACVDIPVIGVPTSIGYGFGSNGVGALASMLQSCTLGLTVVNIDNGIGAGAFASLIALNSKKRNKKN